MEIAGWQPEEEAGGEHGAGQDTGKVRWFGGFMRKKNPKANSDAETGLKPPHASSAETIPFPRPSLADQQLPRIGEDARTLDEARAAVRSVFASLGDQRPMSASAFQAPVSAVNEQEHESADNEGSDERLRIAGVAGEIGWLGGDQRDFAAAEEDTSSWNHEAPASPGFAFEPRQNSADSGAAWPAPPAPAGEERDESAPQGWMKGWQPDAGEASDPDVQLRNALLARFPARAPAAAQQQAPELQFQPKPAEDDQEQEQNQKGAGRLAAFWSQPSAPAGALNGQPAPAEDEVIEAGEGESPFDPRLFREIEETQDHANQPSQREGRGGLALAAAWGLFLCVGAGLIAGFFAFRDIAADTLPGLAPLYRALGMPVIVQPLIFEGVQYDWATSENKPLLTIKGAVYNRAQRNVEVPDFVITVKDDDPALDREYSVNLPVSGPNIMPEERTDFAIELLSPSRSITAIELELRNIR